MNPARFGLIPELKSAPPPAVSSNKGYRGNTMTKKLLDTAGRHQSTLEPRTIAAPFVTKFARPQTDRVCNASQKEAYKTPAWPSARVSEADSIKSRGWV